MKTSILQHGRQTVCRNTSSIQDSTQNHRELLGIDLYVDQLAFAFPPMWDTKDGIGQDVRRAMKLIEEKREEDRIQSELTICQITCSAKGVIPLCNISRLGVCGTHGKALTKCCPLYRDMQFKDFYLAGLGNMK